MWDDLYLSSDGDVDHMADGELERHYWMMDDLYESFKSSAYMFGFYCFLIVVLTPLGILFNWIDDEHVARSMLIAALIAVVCLSITGHSLFWSFRFKWRMRRAKQLSR